MVVSGIDFDRSYAGTQHLLEHLSASFDISLYVLTTPRSRPWYEQLPHTCHVFPFGGPLVREAISLDVQSFSDWHFLEDVVCTPVVDY